MCRCGRLRCAICSTCRRRGNERIQQPLRHGTTLKARAGNTRRPWAMLHFRPHLIFYRRRAERHERYRAGDALSRRSRSRHLLLALFFPATRHLHNYNLASAVSKTRVARSAGRASAPCFHRVHPFPSLLAKKEERRNCFQMPTGIILETYTFIETRPKSKNGDSSR